MAIIESSPLRRSSQESPQIIQLIRHHAKRRVYHLVDGKNCSRHESSDVPENVAESSEHVFVENDRPAGMVQSIFARFMQGIIWNSTMSSQMETKKGSIVSYCSSVTTSWKHGIYSKPYLDSTLVLCTTSQPALGPSAASSPSK